MTRGNQRDKAREAAQKKAAGAKTKNTMSGTEFARAKESAADIMRQKQAASEAKKAAAAAGGGGKK
ncbi:hypothetical protein GCG54_00002145 [Colletotrichum gloeosporioides]|uniref:Small EDRK-rich factor-like N-terminal domain-containing protein n=2 Tax=Colletotrichum gloeosporioides TaxID=474922 RepID=T0KTU2_COLGC|nr:uncharacterized protein CGMCC3_g8087 [Colletotrichum fructicola]XP_045258604.1 uncharacterized protein GCG54_00002145 [Colletotrichum gloeosporioides]XP_053039548.1 uncharacterized protein COL26b_003566 [Colletotrichum chrysophilum]EQB55504.1 hypothetical protein CGLO_04566 [Colletotrichum gloeosporioides Cg-14]KAJ0276093.1 hypothetical protein CBS470a_010963 [Colletotrichum nupharicola]KAJ0286252.1 hypothetical protein COL940_003182 [Colletotrichum noveboracense]KAE9575981.1 hypothetical 